MEGTHAISARPCAPAWPATGSACASARRSGGSRPTTAWGPELAPRLPVDVGLREVDLDVDREVEGIVASRMVPQWGRRWWPARESLAPGSPPASRRSRRARPAPVGAPPHPARREVGARVDAAPAPRILPKGRFPRILAVQARCASATRCCSGLPFEITVESGGRHRRGRGSMVADRGVARVVVSSGRQRVLGLRGHGRGVRRQFYEGGHTLCGRTRRRSWPPTLLGLAAATVGAGVFADVGPAAPWGASARGAPPIPHLHGPRRFAGRPRLHRPPRPRWTAAGDNLDRRQSPVPSGGTSP